MTAAAVPAGRSERRPVSPNALVAAAALAGILAGAMGTWAWLRASRAEPATAAPQLEAPRPARAAAHRLAKYVEVTGFRVSEPRPGSLQIQFVAVNHSDGELPPLRAHITLHAGGKSLVDWTSEVPSLGPLETWAGRAAVPTSLRAYELPDWPFVKADVELEDAPPRQSPSAAR